MLSRKRPTKPLGSAGTSKAFGTRNGTRMAGGSTNIFPFPQSRNRNRGSRRAMTKSDGLFERRVIREREREASRPYHQFVYRISKERARIQEESENGEGADVADINMRAYENWNGRWGIVPGMSWKHEETLEEEAADGESIFDIASAGLDYCELVGLVRGL